MLKKAIDEGLIDYIDLMNSSDIDIKKVKTLKRKSQKLAMDFRNKKLGLKKEESDTSSTSSESSFIKPNKKLTFTGERETKTNSGFVSNIMDRVKRRSDRRKPK